MGNGEFWKKPIVPGMVPAWKPVNGEEKPEVGSGVRAAGASEAIRPRVNALGVKLDENGKVDLNGEVSSEKAQADAFKDYMGHVSGMIQKGAAAKKAGGVRRNYVSLEEDVKTNADSDSNAARARAMNLYADRLPGIPMQPNGRKGYSGLLNVEPPPNTKIPTSEEMRTLAERSYGAQKTIEKPDLMKPIPKGFSAEEIKNRLGKIDQTAWGTFGGHVFNLINDERETNPWKVKEYQDDVMRRRKDLESKINANGISKKLEDVEQYKALLDDMIQNRMGLKDPEINAFYKDLDVFKKKQAIPDNPFSPNRKPLTEDLISVSQLNFDSAPEKIDDARTKLTTWLKRLEAKNWQNSIADTPEEVEKTKAEIKAALDKVPLKEWERVSKVVEDAMKDSRYPQSDIERHTFINRQLQDHNLPEREDNSLTNAGIKGVMRGIHAVEDPLFKLLLTAHGMQAAGAEKIVDWVAQAQKEMNGGQPSNFMDALKKLIQEQRKQIGSLADASADEGQENANLYEASRNARKTIAEGGLLYPEWYLENGMEEATKQFLNFGINRVGGKGVSTVLERIASYENSREKHLAELMKDPSIPKLEDKKAAATQAAILDVIKDEVVKKAMKPVGDAVSKQTDKLFKSPTVSHDGSAPAQDKIWRKMVKAGDDPISNSNPQLEQAGKVLNEFGVKPVIEGVKGPISGAVQEEIDSLIKRLYGSTQNSNADGTTWTDRRLEELKKALWKGAGKAGKGKLPKLDDLGKDPNDAADRQPGKESEKKSKGSQTGFAVPKGLYRDNNGNLRHANGRMYLDDDFESAIA